MKYVVLIHSNPDPWGHPTGSYTGPGREVPADVRAERDRQFDALLAELNANGEFVVAEALGAPQSASLHTEPVLGERVVTDGPYAETKEHLAGFFLIDCATRERAEQVAAQFTFPGDTVELRPAMADGGQDG